MADIIKFRCPKCNAMIGARPDQAGSEDRCPKCNALIRVPTRGTEGQQTSRSDAALKPGMIYVRCSSCRRKLHVPGEHAGKRVKCPKCGTVGIVPADSQQKAEAVTRPVEKRDASSLLDAFDELESEYAGTARLPDEEPTVR